MPYFIVKTDDDEYEKIGLGERANYSLDSLSQTIRIWDEVATYVVGTLHLVMFKKPNERPKRRS